MKFQIEVKYQTIAEKTTLQCMFEETEQITVKLPPDILGESGTADFIDLEICENWQDWVECSLEDYMFNSLIYDKVYKTIIDVEINTKKIGYSLEYYDEFEIITTLELVGHYEM